MWKHNYRIIIRYILITNPCSLNEYESQSGVVVKVAGWKPGNHDSRLALVIESTEWPWASHFRSALGRKQWKPLLKPCQKTADQWLTFFYHLTYYIHRYTHTHSFLIQMNLSFLYYSPLRYCTVQIQVITNLTKEKYRFFSGDI